MSTLLRCSINSGFAYNNTAVQWAVFISGKHLAEATIDTFWASGLGPKMTERISPEYWPGNNTLGKLLMALNSSILESENA